MGMPVSLVWERNDVEAQVKCRGMKEYGFPAKTLTEYGKAWVVLVESPGNFSCPEPVTLMSMGISNTTVPFPRAWEGLSCPHPSNCHQLCASPYYTSIFL